MKVWEVRNLTDKPEDVGEYINRTPQFYTYKSPHWTHLVRALITSHRARLFLSQLEAWRYIAEREKAATNRAYEEMQRTSKTYLAALERIAELEKADGND